MNKLIFGFDQFKKDGDPIPNLENFEFDNKKVCNCGNVFLGMLQDIKFDYQQTATRQWEDLSMETLSVDDIKNNYIYHIDVNCFAWAFGYQRWPDKFDDISILDNISPKVMKDIQNGKCKLLVNYGYEGLGAHHRDSLSCIPLLERIHLILEKYNIPQESFIYMDSNHAYESMELDTKINIIQYEYCAIDQWRFTKQNPLMMYHGNTKSSKNMKRWLDSKNKIRKKHYLSFNRLPKKHRVDLVVSLDKNNLLDKGYVSFANKITDWDWKEMVSEEEKTSLEKKMPLVIDNPDLSLCKHSYDVFNVSYDKVYDTEKRFSMIENEIIKLCSKSIEEIHDWYWSIEDIIKHNYYHFYEKFIPDMKSKMINQLEELL